MAFGESAPCIDPGISGSELLGVNLSDLHSKLALGTAQLGLTYGINNQQGQPTLEQSFAILDATFNAHITMLDTADTYGESIGVIAAYLQKHKSLHAQVVSKFIADDEPLTEKLDRNLKLLGVPYLYGYLFHRFADYGREEVKNNLLRLRNDGKIKHIGVSVYGTVELKSVIEDPDIDIIQLPINPFDFSPVKKGLLAEAKANGKEIHGRSVFLQGLFFRAPESLTGNLAGLKDPLLAFQQIIRKHGIDIRQACINYALHSNLIDKVIIGIEAAAQLMENIQAIRINFDPQLAKELESIEIPNPALINPSSWKP